MKKKDCKIYLLNERNSWTHTLGLILCNIYSQKHPNEKVACVDFNFFEKDLYVNAGIALNVPRKKYSLTLENFYKEYKTREQPQFKNLKKYRSHKSNFANVDFYCSKDEDDDLIITWDTDFYNKVVDLLTDHYDAVFFNMPLDANNHATINSLYKRATRIFMPLGGSIICLKRALKQLRKLSGQLTDDLPIFTQEDNILSRIKLYIHGSQNDSESRLMAECVKDYAPITDWINSDDPNLLRMYCYNTWDQIPSYIEQALIKFYD